ncbi:HypC/HybG/HupF family hydrogenase formation chaperone [Demequina capsici]|uniref:HypC/HybG/HupF family hydrogenase formation chaperone n=1 Tax=Demequina capsici TaxID=3075620 RepID=A0AA96F413_9MICO|nr:MULTISPECIES: HypC/HybG/HupF family hydrogenase formation chaperone [unclassified Demequina]WNM23512.1 HypC/HybG/HupF family hydrogenase formation chaperone [Demequina sp. OYTSA14]WNM26389.1 HypC/HybG/HupF family hydrogenase formation chaperone [Demequina sp. PMTSA13]
MEHGTVVQVLEVHRDGRAVVEVDGKRQEVLEMTFVDEDIEPGDWVVVKAGFALERLTEKEVAEVLAPGHSREV